MSVFEHLLNRVWPKWPRWKCDAIEPRTGLLCHADAVKWADPIPGAAVKWCYCERHAPPDAEAIPPDVKYWVTRLELRVAVCNPPGKRAAAADQAIRRIAYAIEDVGGVITAMRVPGKTVSKAPAAPPAARLELAGLAEAPQAPDAPSEAPARPSLVPLRRQKAGS